MGIEKASREIIKWFDTSKDIQVEFATSAMLMERAGTGGALFRNLYRDFLNEAFGLTKNPAIAEAHKAFISIANAWSEVAALFEDVAATKDRKYVLEASKRLRTISELEKSAMQILEGV